MKDCEESGLPPWQQCAPKMVASSVFVFNTTYIPINATQPTFLTSSTVDAVNDGIAQDPTDGIVIAGWMTVSLTVLMLAVCSCTCVCCLWSLRCCTLCRRLSRRHETVSMVTGCCPSKCKQRSRTSSGTQVEQAAESDAVPLPLSEFTSFNICMSLHDTVCMELGAFHYAAEMLCIAPWCMLLCMCMHIVIYHNSKSSFCFSRGD